MSEINLSAIGNWINRNILQPIEEVLVDAVTAAAPAPRPSTPAPAEKETAYWRQLAFGGYTGYGCVEAPNPLCETSPAPHIMNTVFVVQGETVGTNILKAKEGDLVSLTIKAKTCGNDPEVEKLTVTLGAGEPQTVEYSETLKAYLYIFKLEKGISNIYIRAEDNGNNYDDVLVPVYFEEVATPADVEFKIDCQGSGDWLIPTRPVTCSASLDGSADVSVDPALYDFQWQWKLGSEVMSEASGENVVFTPDKDGEYTASLKTYLKDLPAAPIDEDTATVSIGLFPKPTVTINGPTDPKSGSLGFYQAVVSGTLSEHEGSKALCAWETIKTDPKTGLKENDTANSGFTICTDSWQVNFPVVSELTPYTINVTALYPGNESYPILWQQVAPAFPIKLHESGSTTLTANFSINYPNDGSIPYRTFSFEAEATNVGQAAVTYEWTITKDNQPLDKQPPSGPLTEYQFEAAGAYTINLNIYDDQDKLLAYSSQAVSVGVFPKPKDLPIDQNIDPIYALDNFALYTHIVRDGGLWPEDQAATFSWSVVEKGPDGSKDVTAACATAPAEPGTSVIYCTLPEGSYEATVLATGMLGNAQVYDKPASKAFNVYKETAGDNKPFVTAVIGPTPEQYTIGESGSVEWTIYANNYDGTTNGLSAECDFTDETIPGVGNEQGIITITKTNFQQKESPAPPYYGVPCHIIDGNGVERYPGAFLPLPEFQ